MEIERSTGFRFDAVQLTETNADDVKSFIETYPTGNASCSYDGDGNITVVTGANSYGDQIVVSVFPGDYVTKIFSNWWTVIRAADFNADYAVISPV